MNKNEKLALAALEGNLVNLMSALEAGADVNGKGVIVISDKYVCHEAQAADTEWTPILWALSTSYPSLEVVKALINAGADIEARGEVGMTPIIQAAYGDNLEVFNHLLKAGAKLNTVTDECENLLHFCNEEQRAMVEDEMLKRERDLSKQTTNKPPLEDDDLIL